MADIVNLRAARKARDRKVAEGKATENRARFGLSKAERAVQAAEADRIARIVDGAKRDDQG